MSNADAAVPLLAVTHLTKHYPMRSGLFGRGGGVVHAVDDVSFTIAEGETLGLVGESGCGKSTIARTVLGLTAPTAGAIAWRGERIDRLAAGMMRPYRQALQAVFQDPYASLNPRMRAVDIVAEPIRNFETASAGDIAVRVLSLCQRASVARSMRAIFNLRATSAVFDLAQLSPDFETAGARSDNPARAT